MKVLEFSAFVATKHSDKNLVKNYDLADYGEIIFFAHNTWIWYREDAENNEKYGVVIGNSEYKFHNEITAIYTLWAAWYIPEVCGTTLDDYWQHAINAMYYLDGYLHGAIQSHKVTA